MTVRTAPPISSLAFYADLARSYDELALISPAFPSATMIYNLMSGHLSIDDMRVLDVGIGTGLSSEPFAADGFDVTGVDGSGPMLKLCAEKGIAQNLFEVDFTTSPLPFQNGAFDAAFSANTFYLLPAAAQEHVITELSRVTKPGGLFAFNYEPRRPGDLGIRFNDATLNPRNPHSVITYALEPERVHTLLAQHQIGIVAADTRIVARKLAGLPIQFETLICRAP